MSTSTSRRRAVPFLVGVAATVAAVLALRSRDDPPDPGTDLVRFWRAGSTEAPPGLQDLLDQWQRHQVVTSVVALALVGVLVALTRLTAGGLSRDRSGAPAASAALWPTVVGAAAVAAWWSLVAAVQGVVAPLAAVLPAVLRASAGPTPPPGLEAALAEAERELSASGAGAGVLRPPLQALLDDYVTFHIVRAVGLVPALLVLLVAGLVLWRREGLAAGTRRRRRAVALGCWVATAFLGVVVLANVLTVADPEPGLLGLVRGGW